MSPNPIVNMLQPAMNPLAGIFNTLKAAQNPIAALQNMALNSPEMQTVVNIINQNGGNAQQAFYAEAKSRGVDPMQALQEAQQQAQSMMR